MSIEDLGEQLVKEKEEKARQIQKQKKREEFMLAAAKITLPLAGRVIEDDIVQKATDFFNSENVLNLTREYNKASTNAAGVINTEQQIQQSGKGAFAYFSDLNFEAATKYLEIFTAADFAITLLYKANSFSDSFIIVLTILRRQFQRYLSLFFAFLFTRLSSSES